MSARAALAAFGSGVWLVTRAGGAVPGEIGRGDLLARRRFDEAMTRRLWQPLPLLALLGALVGAIAGLAAARLLALYHAELAIEPPLARALLRDVAPLVAGLFAAGRIAVGLAARLGGMALANELDALDTLGHDPVRVILAPEVAAVVSAVPIAALVTGVAAVAGTAITLAARHQTPLATFAHLVLNKASAVALAGGVAHTASYLLVALLVGVAAGTRDARDPAAVEANAGAAFTAALIGVFTVAAAWTALA